MTKPFDYIAEANVTASNNFHGDKISARTLQAAIVNAAVAIERLDAIKKAIFYGRDFAFDQEPGGNCLNMPYRIDAENPQRGELIMHSIIGKATEAGELLELLHDVLFDGTAFDEVNFIEEIGDGQWYDAIGLAAVKCTFDECQRINIGKLRQRFPEKFTEHDANNRDLFAERRVLESKPVTPTDVAGYAATVGKQFARMENWLRVGNVLLGDVVGHPRLGNQKDVRTSIIVGFDEAQGICETRNTVYKLGQATGLFPEPTKF